MSHPPPTPHHHYHALLETLFFFWSDAFEQLDLLKVMSDGDAPDSRLLLLEALVIHGANLHAATISASKSSSAGRVSSSTGGSGSRGGGAKASLKLLEKAMKWHRRGLKALAKGTGTESGGGGLSSGGSSGAVSGDEVYASALRDNLCLGERLFFASDPCLTLDMASLYLAHCGADGSSLLTPANLGHIGGGSGSSSSSSSSGAVGGGGNRRSNSGTASAAAAANNGSGGGRGTSSEKSEALERALSLLRELLSLCPSLVEAHLLTARATLAVDPTHPQATLKVSSRRSRCSWSIITQPAKRKLYFIAPASFLNPV